MITKLRGSLTRRIGNLIVTLTSQGISLRRVRSQQQDSITFAEMGKICKRDFHSMAKEKPDDDRASEGGS